MSNFNTPEFDDYRNWIKRARGNGVSWEEINFARKENDEGLNEFLKNKAEEDYLPCINTDVWKQMVELQKSTESRLEKASDRGETIATVTDDKEDNEMTVPQDSASSWQLYKNHLLKLNWKKSAVEEIEEATIRILKRLSRDTTEIGPIKGLVIGHVQSGKTANMAALMAMSADWGWNFFIVLSGTIDSLRKQTQTRLLSDLKREGNLVWESLEHLSNKSQEGQKIQSLQLSQQSRSRYFSVCLKNASRLKDLIEWMQKDTNKYKQLKVLVIDDEADQASINTANIDSDERGRINGLIVNLVEGKGPKGEPVTSKVKSMNYISYTATPYANFLNESTPESLYPKNFISVLKPATEYFGPAQIFGIEETDENDGLNIIREITDKDYNLLKDLHSGTISILPETFKDAISWFLCGTSTMRLWDYKKPISMLVHTSQMQGHHTRVSDAIKAWLKPENKSEIISKCEILWEKEKKTFDIKEFRTGFPEYGVGNKDINKLPQFKDIKDGVELLIEQVSSIQLDEQEELQYTPNIHLCIDNCNNKKGIGEEGEYVRLAYPDPKIEPYPSPAPAFIIVGGNTLSRGLTIEGLISTYFLRASCQADSLMQMGRWFGYRKGYELIPRIWMSDDTKEKFIFLAKLENELRDDLYRFSHMGEDPSEYGPRVKNSPSVSWLKITSKNKMQSAQEVDMDFAGIQSQTIYFEDELNELRENIDLTEKFVDNLGAPNVSVQESALVWRDVGFEETISSYLKSFNFHKRSRTFNQINILIEWVKLATKEEDLKNWNVIVAGIGNVNNNENNNTWEISNKSVGKINRSRKTMDDSRKSTVNIGVLRSPSDLLADIPSDKQDILTKFNASTSNIEYIREQAGISEIPQLFIYRINKKYEFKGESQQRENLDLDEDLIGIFINIPGRKKRGPKAQALTVKLDKKDLEERDDWREE